MLSTKLHNSFGVEVDGASGLSPEALRMLVLQHSLVVVRNFTLMSDSALVQFAANLSDKSGGIEQKLLHWDFGPLMKMKHDPKAKNYLFSSEEVPFHWDGAFHREPLFLLFYCEASPAKGGETLFCHTPSIYKELGIEQKEQAKRVEMTFQTEKLAHYGGTVTVPLVQFHPVNNHPVLRFAEEVKSQLNPVTRTVHPQHLSLVEDIESRLASHTYAHSWRPRDLVLADNFSLIHGRRKLEDNLSRQFTRAQVL